MDVGVEDVVGVSVGCGVEVSVGGKVRVGMIVRVGMDVSVAGGGRLGALSFPGLQAEVSMPRMIKNNAAGSGRFMAAANF